ncbi:MULTISPECIES: hypothetical protein [unclassified Corallococcus]|uniref:hypothetical protein n=1 Tax=unclassified Corallococcus TaxID=2685029 RepID=UPI001A8C0281|nr:MULTISPECIES: hypothetical protein [unclassified Corallococcus]MBN9685536.1 hypothetical protein [Corallococcus sp. NCSPR001]WAS83016.1 hypothetical protein O0N60_27290 [Corallococcus sp. NCRR]
MKPSPFLRTSARLLLTLSLAFTTAACSDDDDNTTPDAGTGTDGGTTTTPMYAFVAQVSVEGNSTSYVILTETLDPATPLSTANATQINGRALGSGISKTGSLFVSSSAGATVTRYDLTASNTLEKTGEVTFAGKGVTSIGEYQNQFQFVSETKAYYFDGRNSQVIIWNPKDMTLTNSISLPAMTVAGSSTTFASNPLRVGTKVLMPLGWRAGAAVTKKAGIIVVDTTNDAAEVVTDERCGYVRDGIVGTDGKVYLATEAYGAAEKRVSGSNPSVPTPCLLKFDPATNKYDESFFKELSTLTNGGATGSLLAGPNGTGYLRVLDETVSPVAADTVARTLASAVAWKWWKIDPAAGTQATLVDTLPASTGSSFLYEMNGRTVFSEFTNNSGTTNYRELTDLSGNLVATHQGLSFSFLQLR